MKKIVYILGVMLAVASCTRVDSGLDNPNNELQITSNISTRASGTTWEANDEIGVYMNDSEAQFSSEGGNVLYTTSGDGSFKSTTPLRFPSASSVDLLAYYPYNDDSTFDPTAYPVDVTDQSKQGAIDLMVAYVDGVTPSRNAIDMTFNHKLSRIALTISSSSELTDLVVKLVGTYNNADFNLTNDNITLGETKADVTLLTNSDFKSSEAIVIPQTLSDAKLVFTISDLGTFEAAIPKSTTEFAIGKEYKYNASINDKSVELSGGTVTDLNEGNGEGDDLKAELMPVDLKFVDDVYEIGTAAGLKAFASIVNNKTTDVSALTTAGIGNTTINQNTSADAKLVHYIDLATVCGEDVGGGTDWTPIGNEDNNYYGTFDGAGFKVRNIYINNNENHQGLFGYADHATIKGLGVSGSITANKYVGGILGYAEDDVYLFACYNDAEVTSNENQVGGIAGYARDTDFIACYNTATITANGNNNNVGGIAGIAQNCTLSGCYNSAPIISTGDTPKIGSIAGYNGNSTISSCYWIDFAGDSADSGFGPGDWGDTTIEVSSIDILNCMDIQLNNAIFDWNNKNIAYNDRQCNYRYESSASFATFPPTIANGAPTHTELPDIQFLNGLYRIYSAKGLVEFRKIVNDSDPSVDGILMNDIDLSSVCNKDNQINWRPIGAENSNYSGTFDGAGHSVYNLWLNGGSRSGLFGATNGATIKNLSVTGNVFGGDAAGGVVGHAMSTTITNCHSGTNVYATRTSGDGGGIVGISNSSTITNCHSWGSVMVNTTYGSSATSNYIGGITGSAINSTIYGCYRTAKIQLRDEHTSATIGGISGTSYGSTFIACYNTDYLQTKSPSRIGGIVGKAAQSTIISACYNTGKINYINTCYKIGGVVGEVDGDNTISDCYWIYYERKGSYFSADGGVGSGGDDPTTKTADITALNNEVATLNSAITKWNTDNKYKTCGYNYVTGATPQTDVPYLVEIAE